MCHDSHRGSEVERAVDQEAKESAITRGQNVVYQMPHDWASVAHVLAPTLDRIDDTSNDVQLLIVCADAEAAANASAAVVRLAGARSIRAIAATTARRAARLLRLTGAHAVAGAPPELLGLVQGSSLKLEQIRCVVLAWVDELLAGGEEGMLETLMAEIPKDAARIVVANEITAEVEALIERYARRARRVAPPGGEAGDVGIPLQYVTVSSASRLLALRRLLDDVDPSRGIVYVRTDDSERETRELLRALGYGDSSRDDAAVRVARAAGATETDLVVLYDIPASREELREAVGPQARRVVALAQPRLLASLRVLAGATSVTPFTLSEAGLRARSREEVVRSELRATLETGAFARELLTLEPLLENYDGIEIAAATLRLLEQARFERDAARVRAIDARAAHGAPPAAGGLSMTRIFLNVGAMDNARPGDLVGAITNEANITSAQVGKIDIRENHSLVEIASDVAESVISKLTGSSIRGRRVVARVDQERGGRGAGRGGRPADRGERGRPRDSSLRRDVARDRGETNQRSSAAPERRGGDEREADRSAHPPAAGDQE
jgi:ATP-dependent RNA helicase DeaD